MSKAKHTPGPWGWFNYGDGRIYLATPDRGRLIVMDFVRFGMQHAQPRFATWKGDERENMGGIMTPANSLDVAHHPDARLIAAAPELLAVCKRLLAVTESVRGYDWDVSDDLEPAQDAAVATIAKAEGGAS